MPSKPSSKPSIKPFERGSGRRSTRQVEDLKKTVDAITVRCFKTEKHRLELLTATTKVLNQLTRETYPSVAIYDLQELVKKINREMTKP